MRTPPQRLLIGFAGTTLSSRRVIADGSAGSRRSPVAGVAAGAAGRCCSCCKLA